MFVRFNCRVGLLGKHRRFQVGVSLIEVMVSIVIASIALLALAGVNASSSRYTKMSQYRGTATQLAADIAERIRANKSGAASYVFTTNFTGQATLPSAPTQLCSSYSDTCTAAELAAYDLQAWQVIVRNQLPEGSVYVQPQSTASAVDVWLVWRDPSVGNADDLAVVASGECPASLSVASDTSIRCSYFRINL